jgi:alpha-beta hydrolase superfamily lysophospholipase
VAVRIAPDVPAAERTAVRFVVDAAAVERRLAAGGTPPLVFCFPGGGYSKEYYDPAPPLGEDYSMAAHLARRGMAVVLCDHLGTGASSHPPCPERLDARTLADVDAQTVADVVRAAAAGELLPGILPPLERPALFAVGHSMGGGLLVLQQARHPRFDALVTMGWSALRMPSSSELAELEGAVAHAPGRMVESAAFPGYLTVAHGPLQHAAYHWPDVPAWVVAADDAAATEVPSAVAGAMNVPGVVRSEAAAIGVPILVVMGEHDLRMPGSDELSAYSASPRAVYFELPSSGHCHNLASTRASAWNRVADWLEGAP